MPNPEIMPDSPSPDREEPSAPSEPPTGGGRLGQDIPELPNRGDPLGNDVQDGPGGLDIGPQ